MFLSKRFLQCLFSLLFFTLVGCGLHALESQPKPTLDSLQQNIINGTKALSYPAVGALVADKSPFCTGTLIHPQLVLTAAHCVEAFTNPQYANSTLEFRVDLPTSNTASSAIYRGIDKVKSQKHPNYSGSQGVSVITNDIAIVVLDKALFEVAPMPFMKQTVDKTWIGRVLFFAGYGRTSSSSLTSSAVKYTTEIPIIDVDVHKGTNTTLNGVVAYESSSTSVCQGDSGGPAFYTVNGKPTIIGVTSFGTSFNCTGPAHSYRTDPYVSWLEGIMKNYTTCAQNADCGTCGTCNTNLCEYLSSSTQESQVCKICKTDADCGTGVCAEVASGLRCVQKCDGSGCCPEGSFCSKTTQGSICYPDAMKCPDISCSTDSECSSKEVCLNQVCSQKLPEKSKTLCSPCSSSKDCGNNGYCDSPDGRGGVCYQACDASDLCPSDFSCKELYAGIKQCVPKDGVCRHSCTQDSDCATDHQCLSQVCKRKNGSLAGEICASDLPCSVGLVCTKGSQESRCMQICGYPSGSAGTPCKPNKQCDTGLTCMQNPAGGDICVPSCPATGCPTGQLCVPVVNICACTGSTGCKTGETCNSLIGNYGVCTNAQQAPCPQGQECKTNLGSQSVCVNKSGGNQGPGQNCDVIKQCKTGYLCVPGLNSCLEDCSSSNVCKSGGQCQELPLVGGKEKYCFCNGSGQCATGYKCNMVQQGTGVCQKDQTVTGCTNDAECPMNYECKQSQCVAKSVSSEPTPSEITTETKQEGLNQEKPRESDVLEPINNQEKPRESDVLEPIWTDASATNEKKASDVTAPLNDGCKCSSTETPNNVSFLLFVLLILPVLRKKRTS